MSSLLKDLVRWTLGAFYRAFVGAAGGGLLGVFVVFVSPVFGAFADFHQEAALYAAMLEWIKVFAGGGALIGALVAVICTDAFRQRK